MRPALTGRAGSRLCGRHGKARTHRGEVDDQFRQPPFPAHPIHDLNLARAAGHSPHKPISPCPRLVVVAEIHAGQEREGGYPSDSGRLADYLRV
jgi:hypothetical protein